ncbi:MAG: ArnT family glycosyltransferase [Tepidisphaeraceae bacterium]
MTTTQPTPPSFATDDRLPLSPRTYAVATLMLLVVGVQLWLTVGRSFWGRNFQPALVVAAFALAFVPPVRRAVGVLLERMRHPTPRARLWATLGVFAAAGAYLLFTALRQQRDLAPKWHDEYMFLLQARMLLAGRLWMPAHPLADFFDTFYVLHQPVFAVPQFPGAAMLYAIGMAVGIPGWLVSLVASAGVVALLYRVVTELVDGVGGASAALMLMAVHEFRLVSVIVLSHTPLLLFALLMIWAWLRWRRERRATWALLIGAFAGWTGITRPIDALCFVIPVGMAIVADLWRGEASLRRWASAMRTPAALLAGATPFIALQVVFNLGVTGQGLCPPMHYYGELGQPGASVHPTNTDPREAPATLSPQKRAIFEEWLIPAIREYQETGPVKNLLRRVLPLTVEFALPQPLLVMLVPACMLELRRRRWVLVATLLVYCAGYAVVVPMVRQYTLSATPGLIFGVVLGAAAVERAWPGARATLSTALAMAIVAVCVTSLSEFNRFVYDDVLPHALLRQVDRAEASLQRPAVLLIRRSTQSSVHHEPVYTITAAWPDDAPVVRAHDLGARNSEIFAYYAQRQPDRRFYLFDENTGQVTPLGAAPDLAPSPRAP